MSTAKKVIFGFLFFILVLAAIVLTRTFMLGSAVPMERDKNITASENVRFNVDVDAAAKHLAEAIQFKTISTRNDNKDNAEQFKALHSWLQKTYPNVYSKLTVKKFAPFGLLFVWKGSDPSLKPILLMSHQDVVPIAKGTEQNWEHPPFAGEISDGYIWGRGTLDIKSGVISILEATENALKNNVKPKRSIFLFFGDNEEIGGKTAAAVSKYFQDNSVHFDYVIDEGMAIIDNPIPSIKGPVAFISIGEKGYMDLKLSTVAAGGHSSMPPPQTAIGIISRAVARLENNQFPAHITEVEQTMLHSLAPYMSFKNRMVIANLWLFSPVLKNVLERSETSNAMVRTTTAPTIFNAGVKENVLPIKASANVNFRILPGDTYDYVIERVRNVIHDDRVTITPGITKTNPSPIASMTGVGYQTIKKVVKQLYDNHIIVAPYLTVGATDSRHFIPVADNVYRFMAYEVELGDATRIHGTNERLSVKNFNQMIRFYSLLLSEQG